MKKIMIGLILIANFANAGTYFECEFSYKKGSSVATDVLSSHGQQSSKVEGFLSSVSNEHSVWNEKESRSESRYYVNVYEVEVGGLNHLKSFAITEQDLNNAVELGSLIKSDKIKLKNMSVTTKCIRH